MVGQTRFAVERIVTVDLPRRKRAMPITYTLRPSEMTMDFIRSVQAMFKDKQKKKQKELQESAGGFCNSFTFYREYFRATAFMCHSYRRNYFLVLCLSLLNFSLSALFSAFSSAI